MRGDESQTYFLEAYEFPLSEADHTTITGMLREQAVFAPSFALETNEDLYDVLFYRRQAYHHDTSITILADRNVVTRWLSVLSGQGRFISGPSSCSYHGVCTIRQHTRRTQSCSL